MHWLREASIDSAKEVALISAINVPIAFVAAFVLKGGFIDTDGLILLLEATGLMLAGGAMELGGTASAQRIVSIFDRRTKDWSGEEHQRVQRKAAVYTISGLGLFAESLTFAIVFGR